MSQSLRGHRERLNAKLCKASQLRLPPPHDQCPHGSWAGAPRARRGAPVLRRRARRGRRAGRRQHAECKVRLARAREGLALRRGGHGGRARVHPPAPASAIRWLHSAASETAECMRPQSACARPLQEPCGQRPMARSACVRRCAVLPCTAAAARCGTPAACKAPTLLEQSLTGIRQRPAKREAAVATTLGQLSGASAQQGVPALLGDEMQGARAQAAPQRGQRGHAAAALAHRGQQRRRRCFRRPGAAAVRRRLHRFPACGMRK